MNQELFKYHYDAINFQREIENMGAKEEFKRKNCAKNYISKAAFDTKLAKLYSQELSVETALLIELQEPHTEEELSEIRDNIIVQLQRLRQENQVNLLEYMIEEENQYNSEQSNIVVVRFLRPNFSIMDNISQDFFSPGSNSSNLDTSRAYGSGGSSTSRSEERDDDLMSNDLGAFVMGDFYENAS